MSVVVASFDVGVKNLAFCVLHYDSTQTSGSQYPIREWRCFDLTDNTGIGDRLCEAVKGNGVKCANGARILTDEDHSYCGVHNPDKTKYKPKAATKVASWSYERLGNALMDRLDHYQYLWDQVDHVVIEQQFSKNRKMIFLSAIIFSYFMKAGQRNPDSKIAHVKFASSRNKLQLYDGPEITERPRKAAKDHRKWLAPKHTEWIIRGDEKWLAYLHRYPRKKDDLCDAFLQGADYVFNDCRASKRPNRKKNKKPVKRKKAAKKIKKKT